MSAKTLSAPSTSCRPAISADSIAQAGHGFCFATASRASLSCFECGAYFSAASHLTSASIAYPCGASTSPHGLSGQAHWGNMIRNPGPNPIVSVARPRWRTGSIRPLVAILTSTSIARHPTPRRLATGSGEQQPSPTCDRVAQAGVARDRTPEHAAEMTYGGLKPAFANTGTAAGDLGNDAIPEAARRAGDQRHRLGPACRVRLQRTRSLSTRS
jgi:hypothetical protein